MGNAMPDLVPGHCVVRQLLAKRVPLLRHARAAPVSHEALKPERIQKKLLITCLKPLARFDKRS